VDHEINPVLSSEFVKLETLEDINGYIKQKEKEMKEAAKNLEFEKASIIRDEIYELRKIAK
jgi:excinuclease ABC subunit B